MFDIENRNKTGQELTLEYIENELRTQKYVSDRFIKTNTYDFSLNPYKFINLLVFLDVFMFVGF